MARPAVQSKEWDFKVVQEQITHKTKKLPFFGNFRTDNGECLGVTTEAYGIVQNGDLIRATKEALDHHGLKGYQENVLVTGKGERLYATFTFMNKQLASAVGDVFGYKLTVKNSFDRSLRASLTLGFLRLVCTNGMATMEKEFGLTRKHNTKVAVDFIGEALEKAIGNGENALKVYDQLAATKITEEQGKNILAHLEEAGTLSGLLRQEILIFWLQPKRKEDSARNLYNLYNAVTDYLTHVVEAERYEYANKVNNTTLMQLVNLTRNAEKFAEWCKPLPVSDAVAAQTVAIG